MPILTIPAAEWDRFCRDFSHENQDKPVTIEMISGDVFGPDAERTTIARDVPLHSLRIEHEKGRDLLVLLDRETSKSGPQFSVPVRQLRLEQGEPGQPGRLRIDTADGQTILLRLSAPVLPGMLDGV